MGKDEKNSSSGSYSEVFTPKHEDRHYKCVLISVSTDIFSNLP